MYSQRKGWESSWFNCFLFEQKEQESNSTSGTKTLWVLNFLCKCVIPGRTFLRRVYSLTAGAHLKPHYHLRLTAETRMDLKVWSTFLFFPDIFCRPFLDFTPMTLRDINMYVDALRNFRLGFGALCDSEWTCGVWDKKFMDKYQPIIEYLELFGITVAVLKWIKYFKNKRIYLFTDNKSARDMINASSSNCKQCMVLIRLITLEGLIHNVRIFAKYVKSKMNGLSEALWRQDFTRFRRLGPHMDALPGEIPEQVWPLEKIWLK